MVSVGRFGRQRGRGLGFWLAVAVLLHAEAGLVLGVAFYLWGPRQADLVAVMKARQAGEAESIDISTVDDEAARKILADLERAREIEEEEAKKKELESPKAPGQVVDLRKPRTEERPDEARFASEHDVKVEKETKKYGKFDANARQGDLLGRADESRREQKNRRGTGESSPGGATERPEQLALREAPQPRPGALRGAAAPETVPAPDPDGAFALRAPLLEEALGGPARRRASSGASALTPTEQQLARAIASGSQDYLKDVDEGEETALNAKKWRFASFFNRMKESIRNHWKPGEEYRKRDPSGQIYGYKDRYTLLRVQLKPDGSLANVELQVPSGVEFLDDVAIGAFKDAQPFPNPPRQLVDGSSGMIDFTFGFFFELSGSPKFKVFRQQNL